MPCPAQSCSIQLYPDPPCITLLCVSLLHSCALPFCLPHPSLCSASLHCFLSSHFISAIQEVCEVATWRDHGSREEGKWRNDVCCCLLLSAAVRRKRQEKGKCSGLSCTTMSTDCFCPFFVCLALVRFHSPCFLLTIRPPSHEFPTTPSPTFVPFHFPGAQ